ncbi:hypothetical protein AB4Y43_16790 [Paraburkholderia sp. BR10872]|uniref:hypothetical protein n=1 Tax=Paraburkholderia sp. BR10872 TaxID=3236989 RepID=UPI0034D38C76
MTVWFGSSAAARQIAMPAGGRERRRSSHGVGWTICDRTDKLPYRSSCQSELNPQSRKYAIRETAPAEPRDSGGHMPYQFGPRESSIFTSQNTQSIDFQGEYFFEIAEMRLNTAKFLLYFAKRNIFTSADGERRATPAESCRRDVN